MKTGVMYHPLMDSRESSFDDETVLDDSTKSDSGLSNTNGELVEHKIIVSLDRSLSVSNTDKSNLTVDLTSATGSNVVPSSPGESSQSGNDNSVKTFKNTTHADEQLHRLPGSRRELRRCRNENLSTLPSTQLQPRGHALRRWVGDREHHEQFRKREHARR